MGRQDAKYEPSFYEKFVNESPSLPGDHGIPPEKVQAQNSELYDPKLIEIGRDFVRRNFFSVVVSHLIFMMWVFATKFGRIVIHHTGQSTDKQVSLKRYLATIVRMCSWYEGDFTLPTAGVNKDLVTVRKIHGVAAKLHPSKPRPVLPELTEKQRLLLEAIKEDTKEIDTAIAPPYLFQDEDPQIPLSQFHMSMGQWGFFGLLVAYPELFGIWDTRGMEGYVHMWVIIARHLGIEDRFNWALHVQQSGGDTTELKKIYANIIRPMLKSSDEWTVVLIQNMVEGIAEYAITVRLLPIFKAMLVLAGFTGAAVDPLMSWWERLRFRFFMFLMHSGGKYEWSNNLRNVLIRHALNRGKRIYLTDKKWDRE